VTRTQGEGLPMPRRRTLASDILSCARSLLAALSASMPSLAIKAGPQGMGSPSPTPTRGAA